MIYWPGVLIVTVFLAGCCRWTGFWLLVGFVRGPEGGSYEGRKVTDTKTPFWTLDNLLL